MRKKIAQSLLRLFGWKAIPHPGKQPEGSIICVAPHTSNYDFPLGLIFTLIFRVLAVVLHIQLPTFNPKLTEKSEQEKGVS